jgi:hypothetical protein
VDWDSGFSEEKDWCDRALIPEIEDKMKRLLSLAVIVLLSSSIAFAQDFCKGDFDYDGAVDSDDVTDNI